jgi:hypothetical protein
VLYTTCRRPWAVHVAVSPNDVYTRKLHDQGCALLAVNGSIRLIRAKIIGTYGDLMRARNTSRSFPVMYITSLASLDK